MLKAAGETGTLWMTDVCNAVVKDGKIPENWSRSWMVNVYKGKGDALTCHHHHHHHHHHQFNVHFLPR